MTNKALFNHQNALVLTTRKYSVSTKTERLVVSVAKTATGHANNFEQFVQLIEGGLKCLKQEWPPFGAVYIIQSGQAETGRKLTLSSRKHKDFLTVYET